MHWLTESWRLLIPPLWSEIGLILMSAFCGAIVGSDRQKREKPAGLRSVMFVCIGSATFTSVSVAVGGDPGRIAAQVVAGIGFLGLGVVIHSRGLVTGTTTAATIWVVAAVGMVAGIGHAGAALGLSILVRIILTVAGWAERTFIGHHESRNVEIHFALDSGRARIRLERVLIEYDVPDRVATWNIGLKETGILNLRLRFPRRHLRELLGEIVSIEAVKSVHDQPLAR